MTASQQTARSSATIRDFALEPMRWAAALTNRPAERLRTLREYAAAGRGPLVDLPAWDPDEDIAAV